MQNEFVYPLKIHIEDTDYSGIVYHANYLNFMERARSEWVEQWGMGLEWQRLNCIFFPVHSVNIQFISPARLHEKVEVVTSIKRIGKASLIFDQYLRLANTADKILCKAEIKIACVNEKFRPCAIPELPKLTDIWRN